MERPISGPHEIRNPEPLAPPMGFSHAVVAQSGRTVYLAGQTAQRPDGMIVAGTMAEQFDVAAGNVVLALEGAGARPQDLVSLQIFVTDVTEYQRVSKEIGVAYRRHFGDYYPPMALIEDRPVLDPQAN